MMQSVSYGTNTGAHDQKSHFASCFSNLDVTNTVVPLTVPPVSQDAYTDVNTWHGQKSHATPCFNCLHLMIKMVPLML